MRCAAVSCVFLTMCWLPLSQARGSSSSCNYKAYRYQLINATEDCHACNTYGCTWCWPKGRKIGYCRQPHHSCPGDWTHNQGQSCRAGAGATIERFFRVYWYFVVCTFCFICSSCCICKAHGLRALVCRKKRGKVAPAGMKNAVKHINSFVKRPQRTQNQKLGGTTIQLILADKSGGTDFQHTDVLLALLQRPVADAAAAVQILDAVGEATHDYGPRTELWDRGAWQQCLKIGPKAYPGNADVLESMTRIIVGLGGKHRRNILGETGACEMLADYIDQLLAVPDRLTRPRQVVKECLLAIAELARQPANEDRLYNGSQRISLGKVVELSRLCSQRNVPLNCADIELMAGIFWRKNKSTPDNKAGVEAAATLLVEMLNQRPVVSCETKLKCIEAMAKSSEVHRQALLDRKVLDAIVNLEIEHTAPRLGVYVASARKALQQNPMASSAAEMV